MSEPYKKAGSQNPYTRIRGATDPAHEEAAKSGLPGLHNGPGDAYRHIVGAAEITRRFGEATARVALEGHELDGLISGKQPREEAAMDRHNNEIGIGIGREAKSLDEVIERAREKINSAAQGNEGKDVPRWLPQEKWHGDGTNWPPEWEAPETGKYEFGGAEHRYPGWRGDEDFEETDDPLARPVETWSEDDVNAVIKSDAYWRTWDPDYDALHSLVFRWHEHVHGGGPVQVRAHDRDGGKVAVRSYERSRPG